MIFIPLSFFYNTSPCVRDIISPTIKLWEVHYMGCKDIYEKARLFIYRNARPVELALWRFHFEGGAKEDVLRALAAYQNLDGGFGHALEADSFNPNSAPIQTWNAASILRQIGFEDGSHPIIKGILRYLDSGADFSEEHGQWLNTVKSNDSYPHAIWWNYSENEDAFRYNPTAYLAGFILRFADKGSGLYKKAEKIAVRAYKWFIANIPCGDAATKCFLGLYEYLTEAGTELVDMDGFADKLREAVNADICRDSGKWGVEYVCQSSAFIRSKDSMFYEGNEELVKKECELIASSQLEDGSYNLPWVWCNDYKEYTLAANWWKAVQLIEKMGFLKEFC